MSIAAKVLVCIFGMIIVALAWGFMLAREPARQVYVNDRITSERLFMRQLNSARKEHRRQCLKQQRDTTRQLMAFTARLAASTQRLANCLEARA